VEKRGGERREKSEKKETKWFRLQEYLKGKRIWELRTRRNQKNSRDQKVTGLGGKYTKGKEEKAAADDKDRRLSCVDIMHEIWRAKGGGHASRKKNVMGCGREGGRGI